MSIRNRFTSEQWERHNADFAASVPEKQCERARRDDGLPARLNCDICGRGPCGKQAPDLHWQLYPRYLAELAQAVPNRLYGATVNHEGDAV